MLEIYAGFSRAKHKSAVFSRLIQWFIGAEFSHSYFRIHDKELGIVYVFEAKSGGVHLRSAHQFDSVNHTIELYKLPDLPYFDQECFKRDLIYFSGIHYAYKQNIGVLIVDTLKRCFGIKLTRNLFNDGMNCSEVMAILVNKYWGLKFSEQLDLIDPKDIRNEIKAWLKY